MTVQELIEELQKCKPDAEIISIKEVSDGNFEYTKNPKLNIRKNMFGERVWIV